MEQKQYRGGWEAFNSLSPGEKLSLRRLHKQHSDQHIDIQRLRPRQLFMISALDLLEASYQEAEARGLLEMKKRQPSLQELFETTGFLLPWQEKELYQSTLTFLEAMIANGITFYEQKSLGRGHAYAEQLISGMRNLEVATLVIRNDLRNPYYGSPEELQASYYVRPEDMQRAWEIAVSISRHLGITTEEEALDIMEQRPVRQIVYQEHLPLFAALEVPEQRYNEREEVLPGYPGVVLRIGFQIDPHLPYSIVRDLQE